MIYDRSLIVVTPAGRRRYLEILAKYVLATPQVDRWDLWLNTADEDDLEWMYQLSSREPRVNLVHSNYKPEGNYTIRHFFPHAAASDAVYIRLDDDIVWMNQHALYDLAVRRIADPVPFLLYGMTINSGLTSYIYQRLGIVPTIHGICGYHVVDDVGWKNPEFVKALHYQFLNTPYASRWATMDWNLLDFERHSINVISWLGEDAQKWADKVDLDEEQFLSVTLPRKLNRPNRIFGSALFTHYAYYSQRPQVDADTGIIEGYRRLAGLVV